MKRLLRIVLLLAGAWVLLCGLVFFLQRRMQYLPDRNDPPVPRGDIEDVTLETADGVALRAWYWPGTREAVLLYLHGNAGHRGHRFDWMERIHALGWGIFMLDYRGYGGSTGAPTEEGLYADADAALEWLEGRGKREMAYVGESIGSSVAVDLAARRPPKAMVLQSPAISILAVAKRHYPYLPVGLLMKDRFDSSDKIGRARCPVLFIHGSTDRIVPIEYGRALFEKAVEPKEWYEVDRSGHNDLPWAGGRAYYAKVHAFLERAFS